MAPLRERDLAFTRVGGCLHRESAVWYHVVHPGLSVGKKRGKNVMFDFESRWISAGGTKLHFLGFIIREHVPMQGLAVQIMC